MAPASRRCCALLAGRDRPTRGSASLGVGVRPAYFAQDQAEHLDPGNTVFDEVYEAAPASWDIQAVRDLLGRFLFSGDDQFKSVATLSGGERSRVALAKLLLRPNNLLLLDEPTNHLDIATRERLEETLAVYTGTLIVATHDRYLVNRLATRVIEVADGGVRSFVGALWRVCAGESGTGSRRGGFGAWPRGGTVRSRPRAIRGWRADAGDQDPAARRRLAADLREAERQVTLAEERLRAVEAALSDPASTRRRPADAGPRARRPGRRSGHADRPLDGAGRSRRGRRLAAPGRLTLRASIREDFPQAK